MLTNTTRPNEEAMNGYWERLRAIVTTPLNATSADHAGGPSQLPPWVEETGIADRKLDHIRIALGEDVSASCS
jgi:hypothetical protein